MTPVQKLTNGGDVVVLGTGPSLSAVDVARVRGRAVVVAVKDALRLAPWADVAYTSDMRWMMYHRGWPAYTGPKFTIAQRKDAPPTKEQKHFPEWTVLRNTGDLGIDFDPTALRTGRNSGSAAINLAVHLGASRIVLLGFDMGLGPAGEAHFCGKHPYGQVTSPWRMFIENCQSMVKPLADAGISVINCSRRTALKCWPTASLDEVLEVAA